ncbi:hypothetical protein [Silvibacterium sp.]|uniref:hypothetical protein n=1 Tax=Silvibacterium sp. TaxID=1964179 RepID=UPI0039E5579F
MFLRKLRVEWVDASGERHACPVVWIENWMECRSESGAGSSAQRESPACAALEDTLPIDDGLLEAGLKVPLDALHAAMESWFRRKGYLKPEDELILHPLATEETSPLEADSADKTGS